MLVSDTPDAIALRQTWYLVEFVLAQVGDETVQQGDVLATLPVDDLRLHQIHQLFDLAAQATAGREHLGHVRDAVHVSTVWNASWQR